ncbi:MAG: InlB B-repeat-containing protein [Bacilli bacterium]|nr:InlB B-repeat-containing protein [Bacilli bacterium]
MKNKIKLLIAVILVFFMCLFFKNISNSYSIYRNNLNTKVYLSVLDPSTTFTINFETHGGTTVNPIVRTINQEIGVLPTTTKEGYNFIGWYTEETGGDKIEPTTPVTSNVTYHAHWVKIVCKKATTLHTEACVSGGTCTGYGYKNNDTITYGVIPEDDIPLAGYAYDCDVNNDGVYDAATERFYYTRTNDDGVENAVLVHFTSYDENGQMDNRKDRGSYVYDTALTYLPDSSTWTNPALTSFDGKVSRFINHEDLTEACGTVTYDDANYLKTCQYFMENSRFQSSNLGRAGIWIEKIGNTYYRIQSGTRMVNSVANTSENTARPVIEIPYNTLDGYKERVAYNVTFNSLGGSSIPSVIRYSNQQIGSLPRPTKEGFTFDGWYTDNTFETEVTPETRINSNVTLYAKWEEIIDNLDYVFYLPGTCTFNGSSANITSNSNDCISTINPTGENIDYTATANKYIDTGISLYSEENYNKDYEIGFTINAYDGASNTGNATFMNSKLENQSLNYPGIVFRKSGSNNKKMHITERINGVLAENPNLSFTNPVTNSNPIDVIIERKNGVISYSFNGADMEFLQEIIENDYFNFHTWFGAAGTSATREATTSNAQRYLVGTLSNMYIRLESEAVVVNNITFNAHGGTASFVSKEVKRGSAVGKLPTVEKSGYYFDGWYTEETGGTKVETSTIITSDVTYHAQYKDIFLVTFNGKGGDVSITPNAIDVVDGNTVGANNLPTATKEGYVFDGWYTEETGGTKIDGTEPITSDTTYYAHYKHIFYVTFNGHGGTVNVTPNPVPVVEADIIGTSSLPIAIKEGYILEGWYTEETGGTKIDGTEPITSNTTYHARYIEKCTVTFDANGGTAYFSTKDVGKGQVVGELPTAEYTGYILEGWYTDNKFTTKVDPATTIVNSDVTYVAKWVDGNYTAMIGTTGYTSLADAVAAVTTNGVQTEVVLMKDTSEKVTFNGGRNVYLNLNNHTVSNNGTNNVFVVNNATVELTNGTVTTNTSQGAINVEANAILKLQDVTLTVTSAGARQAIYNDGGTTYISSGTNITDASTQRAAIQNKTNGKIYITGGKITSTGLYAIYNESGTLEIGEKDGTVDATTPVIEGKTYGLVANNTYRFYDGIIKGKTAPAGKTSSTGNTPTISVDTGETKISEVEDGTEKVNDVDGDYKTLYLQYQNKYKITLDPQGGTVSTTTIMVEPEDAIGALPTPTKGAYTFDGWEDENNNPVDDTTIPEGDMTIYAKWSFTPIHSTFNIINDPMRTYYNNISTWKNDETTFISSMETNFNNNNCLSCNASDYYQTCSATGEVQCDRPKGFTTGVTGTINVYTSDATTHAKGTQVNYVTVSDGVIYDMIPGQTYYWELASDTNVYGTITVQGERRILEAGGVRNIRDLGGLEVDTNNDGIKDGVIDYGRMYRGPKLNSGDDVTSLETLGITEEIDLRGNQNDNKLSNYAPREIRNYEVSPGFNNGTYYTQFRNALSATIDDIINGENIYFHCAIGTDRTGTMAWFLEGLLGVSEEDRVEDYELSYFYGLLNRHRFYRTQPNSSITHRFEYMYQTYQTNEDIYNYYTNNGTEHVEQVEAFRNEVITSYGS